MIPKQTIARIKEEARIDEIVGEVVTLKRRGSSLLGLCPFHNEKTPSFTVTVAKGIYKCFGCGKAGDSISFLMEQQQMSYVEALKYLGKKYNIEIIEEYQTDEQQREEMAKQSLTESILIANAFAQRFFTNYLLHNEHGNIGLSYFRERGFSEQIIEKFQLGFAPTAYTALTDAGLSEGYQLDILKQAGLTSSKENSKNDFFHNRVMFPVHNMNGKVIAFGGRIMIKDEKAPKYINTPESDVYIKGKILYGIYFAKTDIRKQDECLLVEGYTDVISLVQSGIENVVASSGTALTIDQIKLIKRLTKNITVLYDGDSAGIKAALRGTDMILEEGMNVRIVVLPDQEDPDSYVRKMGATEFTKYIKENRKDIILFKTSLFAEEAKNDPIKKAELIRDIIQSVAKIPDPIQRSVYIKQCAQQMDMQEQLIITEVNKLRRQKVKEQYKEDIAPQVETQDAIANANIHHEQLQVTESSLQYLERDIVRILMEFGTWDILSDEGKTETVAQYLFDDLDGIPFESQYKMVYDYIRAQHIEGNVYDPNYYTLHENPEISSIAISLLTSPHYLSEGWKKYEVHVPEKKHVYSKDAFSGAIRIKQRKSKEQLKALADMIRDEIDEDKKLKLIRKLIALQAQAQKFAKETGTVLL